MVNCIRCVNSWFTSNTYILSHCEHQDVWLIDPGDIRPITQWMSIHGKNKVTGILLTHAHLDHIYGINDVLCNNHGCVVYVANEYGNELLHDAKKNASRYSEMGPVVIDKDACIRYYESDLQLWPGVKMNVYYTPGHSDDSVCLRVEDMLFTGDTLIKDTRTVTKLKSGSIEKLETTIALLETFKGYCLTIMAGHEDSFLLDDYELNKMIRRNHEAFTSSALVSFPKQPNKDNYI